MKEEEVDYRGCFILATGSSFSFSIQQSGIELSVHYHRARKLPKINFIPKNDFEHFFYAFLYFQPLVKFKSHLYYEERDYVLEAEKKLQPANTSKVPMLHVVTCIRNTLSQRETANTHLFLFWLLTQWNLS